MNMSIEWNGCMTERSIWITSMEGKFFSGEPANISLQFITTWFLTMTSVHCPKTCQLIPYFPDFQKMWKRFVNVWNDRLAMMESLKLCDLLSNSLHEHKHPLWDLSSKRKKKQHYSHVSRLPWSIKRSTSYHCPTSYHCCLSEQHCVRTMDWGKESLLVSRVSYNIADQRLHKTNKLYRVITNVLNWKNAINCCVSNSFEKYCVWQILIRTLPYVFQYIKIYIFQYWWWFDCIVHNLVVW